MLGIPIKKSQRLKEYSKNYMLRLKSNSKLVTTQNPLQGHDGHFIPQAQRLKVQRTQTIFFNQKFTKFQIPTQGNKTYYNPQNST